GRKEGEVQGVGRGDVAYRDVAEDHNAGVERPAQPLHHGTNLRATHWRCGEDDRPLAWHGPHEAAVPSEKGRDQRLARLQRRLDLRDRPRRWIHELGVGRILAGDLPIERLTFTLQRFDLATQAR